MRYFSVLLLFLGACVNKAVEQMNDPSLEELYHSATLQIQPLSEHTYVHISQIVLEDGHAFDCNGLLYVKEGDVLVFDTPATEAVSEELLAFIRKQGWTTQGVLINHHHTDCLGGLSFFHKAGIASWAHQKTIAEAALDHAVVPMYALLDTMWQVGKLGPVQVYHPGAAHTNDNIVAYVEEDSVLFGGCMIKSLGASKGNIADADTLNWPQAVQLVKHQFPAARYVVPGHGAWGDTALLTYTANLFKNK